MRLALLHLAQQPLLHLVQQVFPKLPTIYKFAGGGQWILFTNSVKDNFLVVIHPSGYGIIDSSLFRQICGNRACSHKVCQRIACGNRCSHKFFGTDYLVFQKKIRDFPRKGFWTPPLSKVCKTQYSYIELYLRMHYIVEHASPRKAKVCNEVLKVYTLFWDWVQPSGLT